MTESKGMAPLVPRASRGDEHANEDELVLNGGVADGIGRNSSTPSREVQVSSELQGSGPSSSCQKPGESDLQEASKALASFAAAAAHAVLADSPAQQQQRLPPKPQLDGNPSRTASGAVASARSGSSSAAAGAARSTSTSSGQQLREVAVAQAAKREAPLNPHGQMGEPAGALGTNMDKLAQAAGIKRQRSDTGDRGHDTAKDREWHCKGSAAEYPKGAGWSPGMGKQYHLNGEKPSKRGKQQAVRQDSGDSLSPVSASGASQGAAEGLEEQPQRQEMTRWEEQLLLQGQEDYQQQQGQQGHPHLAGSGLGPAAAAAGGAAGDVKPAARSSAGAGFTSGNSKRQSAETTTTGTGGRRSNGGVPLATQGELSDSAKLAIIQSLDPKLQCLVECGTAVGVFSVETQRMLCLCKQCMGPHLPGGYGPEFMPSEFERHGGMAACKKWRFSVKVVDGAGGVTIGRWLDQRGINITSYHTKRQHSLPKLIDPARRRAFGQIPPPGAPTGLGPTTVRSGPSSGEHDELSNALRSLLERHGLWDAAAAASGDVGQAPGSGEGSLREMAAALAGALASSRAAAVPSGEFVQQQQQERPAWGGWQQQNVEVQDAGGGWGNQFARREVNGSYGLASQLSSSARHVQVEPEPLELPEGLVKTLGPKYGLVKPAGGDLAAEGQDAAAVVGSGPEGLEAHGHGGVGGKAGGPSSTSGALVCVSSGPPVAAAAAAAGADAVVGADNIQRQLLLQLMGLSGTAATAGVAAGAALPAAEAANGEALLDEHEGRKAASGPGGGALGTPAEGHKLARTGLVRSDGTLVGSASGMKGSPTRQNNGLPDHRHGLRRAGGDGRHPCGRGGGGEDRSLESLAAAAAAASAAAAAGAAAAAAGGVAGVGTSYAVPAGISAPPSQLLPLDVGTYQFGVGRAAAGMPSGPYSVVERNAQLQETMAYAGGVTCGPSGTVAGFGGVAPSAAGGAGTRGIGMGSVSAFRPAGDQGTGGKGSGEDGNSGAGALLPGGSSSGDWNSVVSKVETRLEVLLEDRKRKRQLEEEIEGLKDRVKRLEGELQAERRLRAHAEEQLEKLSGFLLSKLDPGEA